MRRWFFSSAGQVPIDRRGASHADAAPSAARDVLTSGGVWAIHPEGTRSSGDAVYRGHTGAVRVAQDVGVPIVPLGIRSAASWSLRRTLIVIGRPLPAETLADAEPRSATDRLMSEVAVLAGQHYLDSYAPRRTG